MQAAAFARQTDAGYEPTEFTNSRGVRLLTGSNGNMRHPFRAGVVREPLGREERIEAAETAHYVNTHFGRDNLAKGQRACKGSTGRCVWEEYFDVIVRLGGARMDLWQFRWTDGMHTSLIEKQNLWPLLKGGKKKAEPVRPALTKEKRIVARANAPNNPNSRSKKKTPDDDAVQKAQATLDRAEARHTAAQATYREMMASYKAWELSKQDQKVASEKYHGIRGPPEFIRGKRAAAGGGNKKKPQQTNLLLTSKLKAAEIHRHLRTQIPTFLFGEADLPGTCNWLARECLSDNLA